MLIRNVYEHEIRNAADYVGLRIVDYREEAGGYAFRFKLRPNDDRYRTFTPRGGRRNAVCWHGYRDFFAALFAQNRYAVVRSALASYDGINDFRRKIQRNIAASLEERCNCNGRRPTIPYTSQPARVLARHYEYRMETARRRAGVGRSVRDAMENGVEETTGIAERAARAYRERMSIGPPRVPQPATLKNTIEALRRRVALA
jgi:hypothetical protein